MSRIALPNTDLEVTSICLGTGEIGSSLSREDSFRLLDDYAELGGNFLDTARCYGDWNPALPRSISEKTIGAWMRERGNRDQIVLATKGAHWHFDTPDKPRLASDDIRSDLHGSLTDLQTDRIDLYWLHRDDPLMPVETIIETLETEVRAGKIRYYGTSNWEASRIRMAQDFAKKQGYRGFVADQVLWNAAVMAHYPYGDSTVGFMDDSRFLYHEQTGMAAIPFQSQAFGLFSRMANGTLAQMNSGFRGFYRLPETARRYGRMQAIMAETGWSITQVTLGFLLGQPFTTVPIVGCRNRAHLADSMSAQDTRLSPEQIRYILHG